MKRATALLLTILLIVMLTTPAFSAPSNWAKPEIDMARAKGLLVPEADRNYQDYITRELFCKLIVKMIERQSGREIELMTINPFDDTSSIEIVKAYQLGIVKGVSINRFAPNNLITRQEVAVMMMRAFRVLDGMNGTNYIGNINGSAIFFNDMTSIAVWAIDDVKQAFVLGIIKGIGNNTIDPLGNTTIEQSVLLSLRLFNRYQSGDNNAPQPTTVPETTTPTTTTATSQPISTVPVTTSNTTNTTTTAPTETTTVTPTTTAETTTAETTTMPTPTRDDGDEDDQVDAENRAPNARYDAYEATVRQGNSYVFNAADFANDGDADELQFVAVEYAAAASAAPYLSIDAAGALVIDATNPDWTEDAIVPVVIATISDGSETIQVGFILAVDNGEKAVIANINPQIINVLPNQTVSQNLAKYIDAKAGISITSLVVTSGPADTFGNLSADWAAQPNQLVFSANDDPQNQDKYEAYLVTVDWRNDATGETGQHFLLPIVKYGSATISYDDLRGEQ